MCDSLLNTWEGVAYRLHGRDRRGVDCVGIAYGIYAEKGIRLPGSRLPKTQVQDLLNLLRGEFTVVRDNMREYDFLLFRLSGGDVLHCGIHAGDDRFLHVMGPGGVKAESASRWRPQLIKAFR